MTGYDDTRDLAYAWDNNTPDAPYIGVRAFAGATGVRGLVNAGLTIDRAAKWGWISGGTAQSNVGPGDIFFVIASGPFSIDAGATLQLGFGIAGGSDLPSLQAHSDQAVTRWEEILAVVGVKQTDDGVPEVYALYQNYPNPFNPLTTIRYQIREGSPVYVSVVNLLGQTVADLVHEYQEPGTYEVTFDAGELASGIYLYTINAGSFTTTRKLVLLR
ncbi:MAG: T9SS type A sorting domain-containing protein [Ignavibacteria bacterium]|nr:T9SS type A sorting domain-containing protein [Ignavibacteria bacterium]